jgi:CBS domain-containing protein
VSPERDLTVKDIMVRDVPVAEPETSIANLAKMMVEHGVPGVPVVNNGRLIGIVTEGDLIQREARIDPPAVASILDAVLIADAGTPFEEELRHVLATRAEDLMSSPVISIRDIATPTELATLMMQRKINPIPVVDDNRQIVGLATRRRLVELIAMLESDATTRGEPAE